VIKSAITTGASITITGTVSGPPGTRLMLDFFSNPTSAASGQTFLGSKSFTTNSFGKKTFTVTFTVGVSAGAFVTATETDPSNNTSEFSQPFQATSSLATSLADQPLPGTRHWQETPSFWASAAGWADAFFARGRNGWEAWF
jgi:hypothetical protein